MASANSTISIGKECDGSDDKFKNIRIEAKDPSTGEFYSHFSIEYKDTYKILTDNLSKKKYYLYCRGTEAPKEDDGLKIKIPVSTVGTMGAPINGWLNLLQVIGALKTTYEPNSITSPCGEALVKDNKITDILKDGNANNVDVIFIEQGSSQSFQDNNNKTIPLSYNHNELSALQKAQWIEFISAFFNLEQTAESIYKEISDKFRCHLHNLEHLDYKPSITPMRLQSSDNSDSATKWDLLDNEYYKQIVSGSGGYIPYHSVPDRVVKNDKVALAKALDTDDIVLDVSDGSNANVTLKQWLDKTGLTNNLDLQFIKNKTIIQTSLLVNKMGYSDFAENAISRPDIFLMDLIAIQYPVYNTTYYPKWLFNLYSLSPRFKTNATCPSNGIPAPFQKITCSLSRDGYSSFGEKGPITRKYDISSIDNASSGISGWGIFGILLGIGMIALAVVILWKRRKTGGKPLRIHTLRRKDRNGNHELANTGESRPVNQTTPLSNFSVDDDDDSMDPVSLGRPVENA